MGPLGLCPRVRVPFFLSLPFLSLTVEFVRQEPHKPCPCLICLDSLPFLSKPGESVPPSVGDPGHNLRLLSPFCLFLPPFLSGELAHQERGRAP